MMKKISLRSALPSAILYLAVFAYFAFAYPYHVSFKEQFQLFEFTWDYAFGALWMVGGLADLVGRFFLQFFLSPVAGALILAAIVTSVQLLSKPFIREWSLLPAICMWVFLADYITVLTAAASLLMVLGAGCLACGRRQRTGIAALVSAALYFFAGPVAVLYAFLPAPKNGKGFLRTAVCVAVVVALAFVSPLIFKREPWRFFAGVEYLRAPHLMPVLLWIAAAVLLIWLLQYIPALKSRIPAYAVSVVAAAAALWLTFDATQETLMKYDYLAARGKWDKILSEAGKEKKYYSRICAAVNLALSQKGQLCEKMFQYPQADETGLIPEQGKDCFQPLMLGEIFYHMGLESQARRCFFEAQESIPNLQKSARCCKRLAQINLLMGYDKAAEQYLERLRHSLFYSAWAKRDWKESPEFEKLSSMMPKKFDGYYDFVNPEKQWLVIAYETGNPVITEYLLARAMLRRDSRSLGRYLATLRITKVSRHLEEAVLALQTSYPELMNNIRISSDAMEKYMKMMDSGNIPSGTFWKYLNAEKK